ncbi:MAG: hypothetical protein HKN16_00465 [Saprospiraceae bacterium]|nr:hypothetical protein [Saprospiraceae bacterium]
MNKLLKAIFLLSFLSVSILGSAQPKINSPFSRFGLGDIPTRNFPALSGMGGLASTFADQHHLNFVNPASYAFLSETAFEIGFDARRSNWIEGNEEASLWTGNLTHLALGFQFTNQLNEVLDGRQKPLKFGMAVGLAPRTQVGYNIQTIEELNNETQVISDFTGEGGTYTLTWGNALRYKNFGFGFNFNYLFGNIETLAEGKPNTLNSYGYSSSNSYSVRGVLWDIGALYKMPLADPERAEDDYNAKRAIVFGAHVGPKSDFNTNQDLLTTRLSTTGDLDTFSLKNERGEGVYPMEFGVGVMYEIRNRFRVGVDYSFADWSSYQNDAAPEDPLQSSYSLNLGAELIPEIASVGNYWKRMRYRAGFRYTKDPREVLNTSLTNLGVTFGLGIPVLLARQQASYVNVNLELGQFGSDDTLKENYIRLALGFTLNDNLWFFKRKFN